MSTRESDHQKAVFERLFDEFGDQIDRRTIGDIAEEEVARFEQARIHTFVPVIALRRARDRLRHRAAIAAARGSHSTSKAKRDLPDRSVRGEVPDGLTVAQRRGDDERHGGG